MLKIDGDVFRLLHQPYATMLPVDFRAESDSKNIRFREEVNIFLRYSFAPHATLGGCFQVSTEETEKADKNILMFAL